MKFTLFRDLYDERLETVETTWPGFVEWVHSLPPVENKARCQLFNLCTFGDKRTVRADGTLGGFRNADNVVECFGAEIDYDGESMSYGEAVSRLKEANIEALVYTSPSYSDNAPRWRVIVPFEAPGTLDDRRAAVERVNDVLGGVVAGESNSRAQAFYVGPVAGVTWHATHLSGRGVREAVDIPRLPVDHKRTAPGLSVRVDESDLVENILAADEIHPSLRALSWRFDWDADRLADLVHRSTIAQKRGERRVREALAEIQSLTAGAARKRQQEIQAKLAAIPAPPRPVENELPVIGPDGFASMKVQPRKWIVPSLIPKNEPTLIYGPGATGKSLLLLQLAISVAAWRPWLGVAVPKGRVLMFTCEDDVEEIHRRSDAILKAYGTDWASLDDRLCVVPMRRTEMSAVLASPTRDGTLTTSTTYQALKRLVDRFKPDLVICDTLADVFGGNENDRAHAKQFLKLLDSAFRCTFIVTAHPSVGGEATGRGMSGSTGWQGAVRSHLYFERVKGDEGFEADPDLRRLSNMKGNYGKAGAGNRQVRWQSGVFVETDPSVRDVVETDTADAVFLELLRVYNGRMVHVSTSRGPNNAPAAFAKEKLAKEKRVSKTMMAAAMGRLLDAGRIVHVAHRTGADPRYHLEIAPE